MSFQNNGMEREPRRFKSSPGHHAIAENRENPSGSTAPQTPSNTLDASRTRHVAKRRGRPPPPILNYVCTGCAENKPTIRDGVHVDCFRCHAPPNPQLARLWQLENWPSVAGAVIPTN